MNARWSPIGRSRRRKLLDHPVLSGASFVDAERVPPLDGAHLSQGERGIIATWQEMAQELVNSGH